MRAGLPISLAACALGACARLPTRPAIRTVHLKALAPLSYVAPPSYSVHYGVFRDPVGPAWGAGRVLAARWRKDLGYKSLVGGLAFASGEAFLLERLEGGYDGALHRLGPDGATVSSAPFAGYATSFVALRDGGRGLLASLAPGDLSLLSPDGVPVVSFQAQADRIAAADLDGDGRDELILRDWKRKAVDVYDQGGRRLWSKSGYGHIYSLTAAKGLVLAVGGQWKDNRLALLDGRGKVLLSTPVAWSEFQLAVLDGEGVAGVGHSYPDEREALKAWRLEGKRPAPRWRAELGWASASALALADLDGDGRREIVVGTKNGWLLAFSGDGRLLSEKSFIGEVSHLAAGPPGEGGRQSVLAAFTGIPPQVYGIEVIPDPGPWKAGR